ncbi:MAG: cytochrome c [Myxococcota bacterium]|nr:cytochrome c [Myxococcota bacterium]
MRTRSLHPLPSARRVTALRLSQVLLGAFAMLWIGPQAAAAGDYEGEGDYVRYCASCHGMDGSGDGPAAPALKAPPPDLRKIAARRDGVFPHASIIRMIDGRDPVIGHGSREMPVWGTRLTEHMAPGLPTDAKARGTAFLLSLYLAGIQLEASGD